jgi:hypothetical protein
MARDTFLWTVASAVAAAVNAAGVEAKRVSGGERDVPTLMALTQHERNCVLRYRGRNLAKKLGVA